MLDADPIEAHFQLFGDQHGHRRVGALSHLNLGHSERHGTTLVDADESIGREWRNGCGAIDGTGFTREIEVLSKRRNAEDD